MWLMSYDFRRSGIIETGLSVEQMRWWVVGVARALIYFAA
jgi:hypothetical protein